MRHLNWRHALWTGKQLSAFWRTVKSSYSVTNSPVFFDWTLKMKTVCSFESSLTFYQSIPYENQTDLNRQKIPLWEPKFWYSTSARCKKWLNNSSMIENNRLLQQSVWPILFFPPHVSHFSVFPLFSYFMSSSRSLLFALYPSPFLYHSLPLIPLAS